MTKQATPKTLQQAIIHFSNPDNCLNYLAARRWPKGVICPTCGRDDVTFLAKQNKWQCKSAHKRRQFTVKVGTIFEDSPLSLDKWLMAVWMVTNCKNGVSSYEIHRAIGVTQKTAWFMVHRIRLAMQTGTFENKMGGQVEVDETYIGACRATCTEAPGAEGLKHGRHGQGRGHGPSGARRQGEGEGARRR